MVFSNRCVFKWATIVTRFIKRCFPRHIREYLTSRRRKGKLCSEHMHIHVTCDSLKPSFSVRLSSRYAHAGVQCIAQTKIFSKVFLKWFNSCLQNITVTLEWNCYTCVWLSKMTQKHSFYLWVPLGENSVASSWHHF